MAFKKIDHGGGYENRANFLKNLPEGTVQLKVNQSGCSGKIEVLLREAGGDRCIDVVAFADNPEAAKNVALGIAMEELQMRGDSRKTIPYTVDVSLQT